MVSLHKWAYGILFAVALGGCLSKPPVLIGVAVELTGRRGELGVAARDGAQLAVDVINEQDGINGRLIELIVRDDTGDPDTARRIDAELVEQGVVAIIGHVTSAQTAAVFEQMNRAEVVLVSPTSSSTQFSAQDDYFFRVMPSNELMGQSLAIHIYTNRDVRQIVGIYDLSNRAFTETYWEAIRAEFERLGGDAETFYGFAPGETDLQDLMGQVKAVEPEAVVFIASPIDTALMIQYGRQQQMDSLLFSSTWAQTGELLEKGGKAVEGLELGGVYNPQDDSLAYQAFVQRFEARYHREPGLAASHSYEVVLVLAEALGQTGGRAAGLREALSSVRGLQGVQGIINIDEHGDVKRDVYILRVEEERFKLVSTIHPVD